MRYDKSRTKLIFNSGEEFDTPVLGIVGLGLSDGELYSGYDLSEHDLQVYNSLTKVSRTLTPADRRELALFMAAQW